MKIFLRLMIIILVGSWCSAKTMSDNLVQDLSCENLSVDSIYERIREDAFSEESHIPLENWSTGVLGNCWSLSRSQRLLYMLGRTQAGVAEDEKALIRVLDMIRGGRPIPGALTEAGEGPAKDLRLKEYAVFFWGEGSSFRGSSFWQTLMNGVVDTGFNGAKQRSFVSEIEEFQRKRFYKASNVKMGLGAWARTPDINEQTFAQLKKNLDRKRLTLMVLRADQTVQHVIVVKKYEVLSEAEIRLVVYDSNFPRRENTFIYRADQRQFYAENILGPFYGQSLNRPVGAFIVDEEERTLIDQALLKHYRSICKQ